MDKIDFRKEMKEFYTAKPGKMTTVILPKMKYIMVDGKGDPNTSQEYMDAIQTLYTLAYTIKFMCKKELGKDFSVMPLEGLWWAEDMTDFSGNKDAWLWTAMIAVPDFVTGEIFTSAAEQAARKKTLPALAKARLAPYEEGRSAQVMYIGPYADEGPTIEDLHEYIRQQGGTLDATNKHHHEIYFSDPRRTAPEKLKTLIRQPF